MARRFLGSVSGLSHRTRFYLAPDAIEIDDIEGYRGTRKRVLLDEVLLVTLDRRRNRAALLTLGAVALCVGLIALAAVPRLDALALAIAGVMMSPFLVLAALHAAIGTDCVTVFGKRSTAQLAFRIRKRRARAVFLELRERIAASHEQARARAEPAADVAAPAGSNTAA